MPKELLLYYDEKRGVWDELKEPYATIACRNEEEYRLIEAAVEHYRKHARWNEEHRCTHCGEAAFHREEDGVIIYYPTLYCPHCGVKMDLEDFIGK